MTIRGARDIPYEPAPIAPSSGTGSGDASDAIRFEAPFCPSPPAGATPCVMIAADIRDALDHDPFEPIRSVTNGGDRCSVRDPHSVALMKSRPFIALPDGHGTIVPYSQVSAVETLANGKPHRRA